MKAVRNAESLMRGLKRSGSSFVRFVTKLDRQGVPYLSHTKVTCLERCPRCYYRQFVLGEQKEYPAMVLGSLFHLAARTYYTSDQTKDHHGPAKLLRDNRSKKLVDEDRIKLANSLELLRANHWEGHEIASVEEPFFMDLASGLPPVIGVPDLVLRRNGALVVVDHKTGKSFGDRDPSQLILYAEHLRRFHRTQAIVGSYDEYRMVPDLTKVKKPAFRRTPISVDRSFLGPLIKRYRQAWSAIIAIDRNGEPDSSPDCWVCMTFRRAY